MLSFLLLAAAQAATAPVADDSASKPEIVVKGDKKRAMVCTDAKPTGSRVGRGRVCRTREQADLEAQMAQQARHEAVQQQRLEQAACMDPMRRSGRC